MRSNSKISHNTSLITYRDLCLSRVSSIIHSLTHTHTYSLAHKVLLCLNQFSYRSCELVCPLFTQFSESSFGQSLVSAPWIILQVLWDCCKTTESSTDLFFSSLFDCVVFFLLPFFRDVDGHKVGHDRTGLDCTSWDWGEFTGHSVHCVVLIMSNTPGYSMFYHLMQLKYFRQQNKWCTDI